jgi:hypothetical protein
VGQDGPPTAELAELRQALLEFYEARARPLLGQRRGRMARRLQRQGRRWLNVVLVLLLAIDARVRPDGARVATAGATADRAELDAAAEVLLAYHLGGRRTEDALLAEIQAAWVAYETVGAERKDRALGPAGGRRRSRGGLDRQERAAMDRYLAGWRGWLDRRAGQDAWPGRDG